mmetsp:Transcript_70516/g.188192  ORF Transcript_70516/g.188192 Transcript_70516/m.188192 type:complete len:223 (-) Transcript_70516:409-1077(-)
MHHCCSSLPSRTIVSEPSPQTLSLGVISCCHWTFPSTSSRLLQTSKLFVHCGISSDYISTTILFRRLPSGTVATVLLFVFCYQVSQSWMQSFCHLSTVCPTLRHLELSRDNFHSMPLQQPLPLAKVVCGMAVMGMAAMVMVAGLRLLWPPQLQRLLCLIFTCEETRRLYVCWQVESSPIESRPGSIPLPEGQAEPLCSHHGSPAKRTWQEVPKNEGDKGGGG